jgi:hypothetical protein
VLWVALGCAGIVHADALLMGDANWGGGDGVDCSASSESGNLSKAVLCIVTTPSQEWGSWKEADGWKRTCDTTATQLI